MNSLFRKILLKNLSWIGGFISDKSFLKIKFYLKVNYHLHLNNPKTFNEKLQWLKLYDRNPLYTEFADKVEVKRHVANKIGDEYIIPTIAIYNSFDEVNLDTLPNEFVMKCSHDSGGIVICKNKNELNIEAAKKKIEESLKNNYYSVGREWVYKNIKPRIIIEKLIKDPNHTSLLDYKFFCFNGIPRCCMVVNDRFSKTGTKINFYDCNWRRLPFTRHYPNFEEPLSKPALYDDMMKLAARLSYGIRFCRIDFYDVEGKIYFGEYTFYPGNGWEEFEPIEWDYILGEWLVL